MKKLTFTISEELFNKMCEELLNDTMTNLCKEIVYNNNFSEDELEVPQLNKTQKTPPPKPTPPSIEKRFL